MTDQLTDETVEQALEAFRLSFEGMAIVDRIEASVMAHVPVECEVRHVFTPGLYCRQCLIPEGTLLTSKIHKTEHQFVIAYGLIWVWCEKDGERSFSGPVHGITQPGTRRVLVAFRDTLWMTFHPTQETDVEKIEKEIILPYRNPLLQPCLG